MEDAYHLGIKDLITNKNNEILLFKVNPKALNKQVEPYWDLPGGRVQKGDSVEETLRREAFEETGIETIENIVEVDYVLSNIRIPLKDGDVGLILGIFSCSISETSKIKISYEHLEYKWFDPKTAAKLLEVKYPQNFTNRIYYL